MFTATERGTGPSDDAARACDEALGSFLRASGDPLPVLDHALCADPASVPAHLLRMGIAVASKDRAAAGAIDTTLARLAKRPGLLSERDRMHVAAAHAWRAFEPVRAAALYTDIARVWPHDLLALRLAQSCHYMLGDARALHDVAARAAPYWRAGMPGYDCWLAMHAFGLEEIGECARAEAAGRRALAIEPRNPAAIHAVAHAFMTRGDYRGGLHWMDSRAGDWTRGGGMLSHNWWHVALFHLALGAPARALEIYDAAIAPGVGHGPDDAAALLWRLGLAGVDVGERWRPVADALALRPRPALWPLADVHAALAFAAAGRAREMDRLVAALATGSPTAREVALPIARAMAAFAAGDYGASAALLRDRRSTAWRIGGSRLQQEIVDVTLAAADARIPLARPLARLPTAA